METNFIQAIHFIFLYIFAVMIFLIFRVLVIATYDVNMRKKVNIITFLKLIILSLTFYDGLQLFINSFK